MLSEGFALRLRWVAGAAAFVAVVALASAQDSKSSDSERWTIFEREEDLAQLIDTASLAIRMPIEYSRADVTGKVSVRLPHGVTVDVLWEFTNRTLVSRGLTTVQQPGSNALTVVKLADAMPLARLEDSLRGSRAGFVKWLAQLSHERTDSVTDAVKMILTKHGTVTAFKDSRSVLVADSRANVLQAQSVIAQLDGSSDDVNVIEVPVVHSSPTVLAALIDRVSNSKKAVFGDKGKGAVLALPESKSVLIVAPSLELDVWRGLIDQFDRAEPVTTINYSPRRFALSETARLIEQIVRGEAGAGDAEPWRLVNDSLTGTLVVTTTPARHQEIERLLERLESMAHASKRPIRSYSIKNRSVEELQGLLQGLLDAGALKGSAQPAASATSNSPMQGVTAPLANAPPATLRSEDFGDKVIITVDRPTNRLIAMGESRVLEQLEVLIAELDVRQPQVLVEAMVVTLTDVQTLTFGVELQKMGMHDDVQYQLSSLFGLSSSTPGFGDIPAASGIGFGGVVLDPGNFSAVVRALETVNQGRSMAMPKVLVDNNQAATLDSVLQTPYASTNASTTVATTSFGGTLDAGTQIQVTPQIAAGGQLVLDYSISLSSFTGSASDPALPPPRQQNKLKSIATVPDGFTVVVGGLELTTESKVRSLVPILGDLPLIGPLFGRQTKSADKARFFVFLRCNVMRASGFEDLKYATRQDIADANVDDGQPVLRPRIMR